MERYELANGNVYEVIRYWRDTCAVAQGSKIVFWGTYSECRRYIEKRR